MQHFIVNLDTMPLHVSFALSCFKKKKSSPPPKKTEGALSGNSWFLLLKKVKLIQHVNDVGDIKEGGKQIPCDLEFG
jgi:hypothetical protein